MTGRLRASGGLVARPSRILLVGAGHAHLPALRWLERERHGHEVTLLDPGDFWYSGLATGVVGGSHPPARDRVDVGAVAAARDARRVRGWMASLDLRRAEVVTDRGEVLPWDVVSLDLGSAPRAGALPGGEGIAVPVKPLSGLVAAGEALAARYGGEPRRRLRALVVGGGPSGCEVALNLAWRGERKGGALSVSLVAGEGLLPGFPPGAARAVAAALRERGVEVVEGRIARVERGAGVTAAGERVPFDLLVDATGVAPPSVVEGLGLPLGPRGGIAVGSDLASPADPRVFAVGDCADVAGHELPRLGVHAVKGAPVLVHNLLATLRNGRTRPYEPRRRVLQILNLGWGEGLATWGGLSWRGHLSMVLKDHLDLQFLQRLTAS